MFWGSIASIVTAILPTINKAIPDKDLAQKLAHDIAGQAHEAQMAQIEVNKVEASHSSVFVSGWRPAVGWICAIGLAYDAFIREIFIFAMMAIWGIDLSLLPSPDVSSLTTLLIGMLGLGVARTFEKTKGIARDPK